MFVLRVLRPSLNQAGSSAYQKHARAFMRTLARLGEAWRTLSNQQRHIRENLPDIHSGMARVRLADQNGPLQVHFGLANAKIQFGIRSFWPKWSFGPLWTILVQYTLRQYRSHSLFTGVPAKVPHIHQSSGEGAFCMRILAHRNRSDFCDLRLRCPSRTPEIAISETRESNAALRFKSAMESR